MKRSLKIILTSAVIASAVMWGAALRPAQAGLATVGAVHDYVNQKWNLNIPYTRARSGNLLNLKYLMQLVDLANFQINGWQSSGFVDDPDYFTDQIAADTAGRDAADILIDKVEWHFFFTPASTTTEYSFSISAAGRFYIDWGDGEKQFVHKKTVGAQTIAHTYADGTAANTHEIALGGHATKYATTATAAISFSDTAARLSAMRGCLGCVFSTIDNERIAANARQPRFNGLFQNNSELVGPIPEKLFYGVHGSPVSSMYYVTFFGCHKLDGGIPDGLFGALDGPPQSQIFNGTFVQCRSLTGDIPEKLFAGIKGPPADNMFNGTFEGAYYLSGNIENLFLGIEPTEQYLSRSFFNTFSNVRNITGRSARIGDKYLYEIWPDVSNQNTYSGATKLSDYQCIPTNWGGAGTKAPGTCEPTAGLGVDDDNAAGD